jgi:hypothetical protein
VTGVSRSVAGRQQAENHAENVPQDSSCVETRR